MDVYSLYIPFDNASLTEEVNAISPSLTSTPDIVNGVIGDAWQMDDETKATYSTITNFTVVGTGVSFGFWLKSVNPGMVTNPNTGATESLVMPLVSMCSFNTAADPVTASDVNFMIWEETQNDGTNVLKIRVNSLSDCVYTSNNYSTGLWHYFWIETNRSSYVNLWIDFTSDSGSLSGTPHNGYSGTGKLECNNAVSGYNHYRIARNACVIDDFVVYGYLYSDLSVTRDAFMARNARYGAALAGNMDNPPDEVDQAIVFDDPSTIKINSIYSSRGNLYVARSDGQLLKGTKTLWESQRTFGSMQEIDTLQFVTTTGATSLTLTSDGLLIQNEIVTI